MTVLYFKGAGKFAKTGHGPVVMVIGQPIAEHARVFRQHVAAVRFRCKTKNFFVPCLTMKVFKGENLICHCPCQREGDQTNTDA